MRMTPLLVTLLIAPSALVAQKAPAQNDSLVALIDRFLATADTNRALARALVDSAQRRADVSIDLRSQFLPWLCGSQNPALLVAFSLLRSSPATCVNS